MIKSFSALFAVALCLGSAASLRAQTRYNSQPRGNSIRVDGTSTTHDWQMEGTVIGGFLVLGDAVTLDPAATDIPGVQNGAVPAHARASILVRTIHSKAEHLPEVMDHLMKNALKEDQFPVIQFNLSGLTSKAPHAAGAPFDFDAAGALSFSGVTNNVSFPISITVLDGGRIKLSGVVPLKMTSYGVTPPAPDIGLGAMRCGDDVKISFDWTLKKVGAQ
jgi:hypothetical protein